MPEGLSGTEVMKAQDAKHRADSLSLMAVSALYAGKALVELLDVDRLFSNVMRESKVEDFRLLKEAAGKFHESRGNWMAAAEACRSVQAMAPEGEKLLLEADIKTYRIIGDGLAELARQMEKEILPPSRLIHRITALARDQDVIAERRAEAYQGLPGHLPKDY